MRLPSADFESAVAANFTTRPLPRLYRSMMSRCASERRSCRAAASGAGSSRKRVQGETERVFSLPRDERAKKTETSQVRGFTIQPRMHLFVKTSSYPCKRRLLSHIATNFFVLLVQLGKSYIVVTDGRCGREKARSGGSGECERVRFLRAVLPCQE